MRHIRNLTVFSAITLLAGIVALVSATSADVALLGKLAIAVALIAFTTAGMAYLMIESFAMQVRRNADFHWSESPTFTREPYPDYTQPLFSQQRAAPDTQTAL